MVKLRSLHVFICLFLVHTCLFAELSPADYVLDKEKSKIEFIATTSSGKTQVPGTLSNWNITADITGPKLTDIKIDVSVPTNTIDTGNKKRDSHLKAEDFLWSEKYPNATFSSTKVTEVGKNLYRIDGDFTLRGHKEKIQFEASVEGTYRIKGSFKINRRTYGITYDAFFLLPSIDDTVEIKFDVVAEPKKS